MFGAEAMLFEEIHHISPRVLAEEREPEDALKDLVEIDRLEAAINITKYHEETRRWKDRRLKHFQPGDLVLLRKGEVAPSGKLEPKWEGPYIISRATHPGANRVTTSEGLELAHSGNADNIRKYYA
jgi:hypothetical protein